MSKSHIGLRICSWLLIFCFLCQMLPTRSNAESQDKPNTKASAPAATVSEVDELFTARSWDQHPRILANSEDFNRIRKDLETDPYLQTWYARIYQYCVAQLAEPVVEYQIPDGVRLLGVSRLASYRITWMAFLYQINGEQRFAQRAVEELLQVCSFSDWNPSHYLDVAQMCYGVGIGYDWLYHYMSDAQRKTIAKALYNLAISQQQDQTKSTYLRTNSNWNPWCNAGLSIAACAIYESYPSQCSFVLSKAVTNVQNHNATLTPAGSYAEGPGYYQLGAGFMVILMETLRSVLGTDFGLSDMEGVKESGQYLLAMNGYSNTFNFGDGNHALMDGALLHWYANRFNMPELSLYQRSMQSTSVMYDEYLAMIWYSPELVEGKSSDERQPDHFLLSDEYESIASFRGFSGDAAQIYTAIKSGMNNNSHTDLDVGDFVLEALGERWITEMGSDNYNLPGYSSRLADSKRWTYYRKRAEGQNTLVVKPDTSGGQAFDAKCQIVSYESAYDGGYAVVDMLDAYDNYGVTQSKRALALFDNRSRVLIRDELKIKSSSTVYWFAHTEADISISADGKTAELTKNGKKLLAQIAEPSNATFTSMTADPLSSSPASVSGENSREGFRKLVICLKNVTNINISVVFTPVLEDGAQNKALPTTTISNLTSLLNAFEPGTTLKTNTEGIYEIYDAEDLLCFASMVNSGTTFYGKQVKLMNDIDLKGRTFTPIGGSGTSNSFRGTFDGNGHVVKNLFIYEPGVSSVAFFGRTSAATIKNFGIESGTIYCGEKSGGLTGLSTGITIEKCFNKAKVISSAGQCGGLVGQIGGANTITDSYNYANISCGAGIAGGIVGYAASATTMTLTNCYHMGELSDTLGRCGLIGFYNTTAESLLVTKVTVNNCYATTVIKSSAVTDNSALESYSNCAKLSVAEMPAMAVTLGSSFIYDCEYENTNAPVLTWQCDTTLPKDLVIETAAQLRLFAYKVNTGTTYSGKTVKLGNNIDLDSVEWIPIGGNTTANGSKGKIFKGSFDGQGYSISNLSVTAKRFYVGFFGSVQGTVRNLGIRSGRVIGEKKVAGLAGYFSGTMENCYNRAAITGGSHTGGLIGSPDAITMTNCYNMGTVEADLVGGGLMGWMSESSTGSVIRNCYNGGSVSGSTKGALAVDASGTNIQFINCHGLTDIPLMNSTNGCTLTDCTRLSASDLKASYTTLGEGFVADNYFPTNGGYPILLRSVYPGEPLPTLTANADGIYEIHTAQELRALSYMVNVGKKSFSKETVLLCADIDLAHEEFVPIGGNIGVEGQTKATFSGTFDGGGHRIYNMDITTGNLYVGLFGFASSATIQNVGVESGTIIGSDKVGAILGSGRNYTKILNCYNRATVSSRTAIGGIVGMLASSGCLVQNCYNAGLVSGNNTVGGIVGYFASDTKDALIENCYNRSDVAGGIVGSVNAAVTTAEIRNCYTLDTTALAGTPGSLILTDCAQISPKDMRGSSAALGEGYAEDYFVQNKLFPVLAWENAGRKTTLTKVNGVYEIRTADDLRLVSYMVRNGENFSGDTLEMRADIDLEGKAWTPIGGANETSSYQFRGTFDGRGYRIYNLKSNESDYGYGGLFGSINTGTIKNLGIESGMIVGSKRTAAIAGYVGGGSLISNCYNKATVYAPTNIGSFVGYLTGKNIRIENCYNVGLISSKSYGTTVGGLIGGISSSTTGLRIKNCYSIGYFYALIGTMMGKEEADCIVENCYAVDGVNLIRLQEKLQFVNSGIIAADQLRAYASVLGSAYEEDSKGINNGYPILTWESGSLCYHDYGTGVVTAPTCTADGYTTFTCIRCGHSYEDNVVKATGHSYESGVTKAPTFTAKGTMTYTCKNDKSHTYTEEIDVLSKSLFFDFDNSKEAQERYNNYVYNFRNFDTPEAWRGRTQGLKDGNLTLDTATSSVTVTPGRTGFNSIYADSVNFDLNYDPDYAEYFQMRFKVTGLVGTKPKASVHFYYSTDNSSYVTGTAVPFDVSYLSSGEYIVITGQLQDEIRQLEEVNRVILHLTGFAAEEDLDAVLTFDYAFVGPYEELPIKNSLFFDFTDKEADRIRYNSRTYGYTNFDDLSKLNWSYPTSGVSELIADSKNDTVTIKAKGTFNASSWPAVYMDTYSATNKNSYPLHFVPGEAEYYQIRFKMKNFRIGETETTNEDGSVTTSVVNPYLKLSFTEAGTTSSVGGTADYKGHADYINSDTWYTATVPLNSAFKSAKEITRIRFYFAGIESISETQTGEITVDYAYIGKLSDLPTPAYTVTFVDGNGKTLATQLVNKGESASYTGKTPTKASDATNHYTFKGWDKALTNITADTIITATFNGEAHSFTYASTDATKHKASCSCGYSKSEDHSYEYKASKNPTTSATGTLTGTCSACSATTTVTLPKLNTTDYTKTTTKAPTCTATGTDKYTWKTTTYGSFFFNVTTKAKGHTEVIDKAVAPTCTATGLTEGKHCSVCKAVLSAQTTVAALGHSYDSGTVTTKPTFTEKGLLTYTCANDQSHTYTEELDPLSKSLFFDFDNSEQAQVRYNNYVYNFRNFDTPEAWRGRTQGLKDGNLTMDTATSSVTITPGRTGFNSIYADSVNFDLNYDPDYAEYFQLRFKVTGLIGTKPKASVHFYDSTDNSSYVIATAVPFDVSYLSSGEYLVVTGQIQEEIRQLEEVNRVILHITGFAAEEDLDAVLTFDYGFVGPYEELPTKDSLYFDFSNTEADRQRYDSRTYGYVQFDSESEKNWFCSSSVVSGITVDNTDGTATLKAKGTLEETTWPAVYMDTVMGSTGNKSPLRYDPSQAEYYQIRFKMKNFRIGDEIIENEDGSTTDHVVNPYLKLSFFADGSTSAVAGTSDFKGHTEYINSDTWFVATVPLRDTFKNATEINHLRIYFGGIESISETQVGEVTVDYVFIGKLEDLPTPAYTVTFVDGNGKTLATQLVNKGEAATYSGKTPTKTSDDSYHYSFKGWDKALTEISADTTVTATYTATAHSFSYAAKDATNHTASCSCGYSKSEAHSYTEGTCPCGAVEVKEPVLDPTVKIGHSLNLASDISINFGVAKTLLAGFDMSTVYMESTVEVYEGEEYKGTTTIRIDPVDSGYYYYFTLTGLTAVQMNDTITSVFYGTKDGQPYYSNADVYKISDYAYSQMNKASAPDTLKTLCADLLRYGAKAQTFKGYRTSALADGGMTDAHRAYLSDMEAVTFGNTNKVLNDLPNAPITWVGKGLDLDSKVCLKFIFNPAGFSGDLADLSLKVSYNDLYGQAMELTLTEPQAYGTGGVLYAFTLDALLASELREVVSVQIFHGEAPVSATLQYSADTYGNNKKDELLELCKALFAYSDSAKAYFAN